MPSYDKLVHIFSFVVLAVVNHFSVPCALCEEGPRQFPSFPLELWFTSHHFQPCFLCVLAFYWQSNFFKTRPRRLQQSLLLCSTFLTWLRSRVRSAQRGSTPQMTLSYWRPGRSGHVFCFPGDTNVTWWPGYRLLANSFANTQIFHPTHAHWIKKDIIKMWLL